jgi:hypothetical protein
MEPVKPTKKCVPAVRSRYSRIIATTSTGNAPTIISTDTRAVHVNTGIRSSAIPGARWRATVQVTGAAMTIVPETARITPNVHRFCPTPGVNWDSACGV